MKIEINEKGYDDINTAVLYRFKGFIPEPEDCKELDNLEYFKADKVIYKGSKDSLPLSSFTKYKFDFKPDHDLRDNVILANLYDNISREIFTGDKLGVGMDEFMNSLSVFVPSVVSSESGYDNYFGSTTIDTNTIYMVEALGMKGDSMFDGVWKIEFYEEEALKGNSDLGTEGFWIAESIKNSGIGTLSVEPAITITLGPDPLDLQNAENMYLWCDKRKENRKEEKTDLLKWCKELEEITCDKVLIMTVTQTSKEIFLKLAYKSYESSSNPHRNLTEYFLRNDEFYKTRNLLTVIDVSERDDNIWLDQRSGTLVGNLMRRDPAVETPILWRKLKKIKSVGNVFSPYHCYNVGDQVIYGKDKNNEDIVWECVIDKTIGEFPPVSKGWILKDKVTDIFTRRVLIEVENNIGGSLNPGDCITILEGDSKKTFLVREDLGYRLSNNQPLYTYYYGENSSLTKYSLKNCKIYTSKNEEGQLEKYLETSDWKHAQDYGIVYVVFDYVGCCVGLSLMFNGEVYSNCGSWGNKFTENVDEQEKLVPPGDEFLYIYITSSDGIKENFRYIQSGLTAKAECENIPIEDNIKLHFPELRGFEPYRLIQENTLDNETNTIETYPTKEPDGSWSFDSFSDFSRGDWTIELKVRDMIITGEVGEGDTNFVLSDKSKKQLIPYGNTNGFTFEFYSEISEQTPKDWKIIVNIGGRSEEIFWIEAKDENNDIINPYDGGKTILSNSSTNVIVSYTYNPLKNFYVLSFVGDERGIRDDMIVKIENKENTENYED